MAGLHDYTYAYIFIQNIRPLQKRHAGIHFSNFIANLHKIESIHFVSTLLLLQCCTVLYKQVCFPLYNYEWTHYTTVAMYQCVATQGYHKTSLKKCLMNLKDSKHEDILRQSDEHLAPAVL